MTGLKHCSLTMLPIFYKYILPHVRQSICFKRPTVMTTEKHGGNIRKLASASGLPAGAILDFSANINPLGPPDWLRPLISRELEKITHYPDPDQEALVEAAADHYGVSPSEIIAGNGSTEILYLIPRVISAVRAVIPVPCYLDYETAAEQAGLAVEKFSLEEDKGFALDLEALRSRLKGNEIVFIGQPNNPTGLTCDPDELRRMARENASSTFVIDEAFADFVDGIDSLLNNRPPNVIILLSLTKFYAVPGLRLGLAMGDSSIITRLRKVMPPWTVNSLALAAGEAALRDHDYAEKTRETVARERAGLFNELQAIPGLFPYAGKANFLLVRLERKGMDAAALAKKLLARGIAIRVCDNFAGLDGRFFRVAVRSSDENRRLCEALREILSAPPVIINKRHKPAIMFQGTSSNAGKSVLAAAFCRIMLQDGYSVAPFKAQNMSLNSFVTNGGGEMGRAQVVQSQACRIEPDVRMNPVLLKPSSETGSQVIVMGKPVRNMDVEQYIHYKPEAFRAARDAFDSLAAEYDAIVMEGAGSPAEINLKHHDIVNMNMAQHANSPVLIVGDIDRGGVFASFVGTMELLTEHERQLVAGFIINRFRGDGSLLGDAITYTERHTGRPTFGVIPYLHELGLPEEDSVTFKNQRRTATASPEETVDIALIDLPHISNFTDFDALRMEPDVRLNVVRAAADLGNPDAVIIPGSKNVIGDMEHLRRSGIAAALADLAGNGHTEIIGICGGFQMIGREISDPHGLESGGRTIAGLGLMPITTTLAMEKTLERISARHADSGLIVQGYEIHHGQTEGLNLPHAVVRKDGRVIGVQSEDGLLWGTYMHGIFDADEFRRWFVDRLRTRRAFPPLVKIVAGYDLEPAFDRLADIVRRNLQVDKIYHLMGLK